MDRYYNNPKATEEYFTIDDDGIRWGWPGDIAVEHPNNSYTMLGRKQNSYINSDNKRSYLFDTKETMSNDPSIFECEAVALPIKSGKEYAEVVFIVLNEEYKGHELEIISRVSKLRKVDGIKFIDAFGTSEITGKRDTKALLNDRNDFYMPYNDTCYKKISFPYDSEPIVEYIDINLNQEKAKVKKIIKN